MKNIKILQIKPNPIGKDYSIEPQLAGEWVDITNTGNEIFPMDNVKLQHIAYNNAYLNGVWSEVITFNGSLDVGKTARVHSGAEISTSLLPIDDLTGADYHIFTGEGFVWNNDINDTARLVKTPTNIEIDKASYNVPVREGHILKRQGNNLI